MQGRIILGGDFKSRALEWRSEETDPRGQKILDIAPRLGLEILNDGTTIFRRDGQRETVPDISLASEDIAGSINDWEVLDEFNLSDHEYIMFSTGHSQQRLKQQRLPRWNLAKLNKKKFELTIQQGVRALAELPTENVEDAEQLVEATMELIVHTCTTSMPRKMDKKGRSPAYW